MMANSQSNIDHTTAEQSYLLNIEFTEKMTSVFPRRKRRKDAIRRKCLDCMCGSGVEITMCHITTCALWAYRHGRDPFRKPSNGGFLPKGFEINEGISEIGGNMDQDLDHVAAEQSMRKIPYSVFSRPAPDDSGSEAAYDANIRFTGSLCSSFPRGRRRQDAMRRKCIDCTCGYSSEVRNCQIFDCALWAFRFGKDPYRKRSNCSLAENRFGINEEHQWNQSNSTGKPSGKKRVRIDGFQDEN